MAESTHAGQRPPGRTPVLAFLACAVAFAALAPGCRESPLSLSEADLGLRLNQGLLRSVKPLDPESLKAPEQAGADARPKPPPRDPFAGMEKVELTVDQVRAWTLENNLDLKVALIDPTIANERLTEEEAKFESVFFGNVNHSDLDQPTSSQLAGSQVTETDIDTGLRIPLITGGTVTLDLPISEVKSNNQFTTLNPAVTTDGRFSIVQPLLRGFGREANTHSIRIQALQSQIVQAQTNLEVIRQVAESERSYWRLYAARRALDVRQDQYELARQQLERAERRYKAQTAPKIEITRAESGLADRLNAIITAENDLKREQRNLKKIMNRRGADVASPTALIPMTQPAPFEMSLDTTRLMQAGLDNRMEMLELELQLAQDVSTIAFAKNQALPLFTMDYTYNVNGLGETFNGATVVARHGRFADWILGANFEIPVGNVAAESRVQQAILARIQRLASRQSRELSIRQEVLDASDTLGSAWQSILASRQASILAGRTLEAEQRQFDVGTRTSTDVLDAATSLANAQLSEIVALTQYQISQVDLAFATGTLLGKTRISWEPSDPRPVFTNDLTRLANPGMGLTVVPSIQPSGGEAPTAGPAPAIPAPYINPTPTAATAAPTTVSPTAPAAPTPPPPVLPTPAPAPQQSTPEPAKTPGAPGLPPS